MSSSVSSIALTQIASGSGAQAAQALQTSSTSGVLGGVPGMNFMDMILAHFADDESVPMTQTTPANTSGTGEDKTNPSLAALQKSNPLAVLQLALASQQTDADGNIVLPANTDKVETLEGQLDFTNTIINYIKNLLPEDTSATEAGAENSQTNVLQKLLAKLETKSGTLQASLSTLEAGIITKDTPVEDIPLPILTLFGLKPSEINSVTQKVEKLEEKLGRDITVEDLIAGVGGLLPPPENTTLATLSLQSGSVIEAPDTTLDAAKGEQKSAIPLPQSIQSALDQEAAAPTDDLAAQLNALDVGGEELLAQTSDSASQKTGTDALDKESFHKVFGGLLDKDAQDNSAGGKTKTDFGPNQSNQEIKQKAAQTANQNNAANGTMIFASANNSDDVLSTTYSAHGLPVGTALTSGSAAQSANILTTSASAGQAHPAAHMVAAEIVKNAQSKNAQTMTLRLDPPELGNVSIKLKFEKDSGLKAHLTVEKPETYMMLQRDSGALERSLQQSGYNLGNGDISFELSHQGSNPFGNNGDGTGENFGRGGNSEKSQDVTSSDINETTTMTWRVDTATGHVRYNIMA